MQIVIDNEDADQTGAEPWTANVYASNYRERGQNIGVGIGATAAEALAEALANAIPS